LLVRRGLAPSPKKLLRLYRDEGLKLRRRGSRKRVLGTRAPMVLPLGSNQRWSLDFVSDAPGCGRRLRILCMVDDFTRECLALVADTALTCARVAPELDAIVATRDKPLAVGSDNCTELTSISILRWSQERQVEWHYITPRRPSKTRSSNALTGGCRMRA
jgi:putative transposase